MPIKGPPDIAHAENEGDIYFCNPGRLKEEEQSTEKDSQLC